MNYTYLRKYWSESLESDALILVTMENGRRTEFLDQRTAVSSEPVYMRLQVCGRRFWFEWCMDGENWQKIGKPLDTTMYSDEYCQYGEFTGTMVGLTCADRVRHKHYADFDFLEYVEDPGKDHECFQQEDDNV